MRLFKKNVAMVRTPSAGDIRNKEPRKGCIVYKDEKERQKLEQALEKVKATTSKVPTPRYYGGLTPKVSTATLDTIQTAIVGQLETIGKVEQVTQVGSSIGPHSGVLFRVEGTLADKAVRCMIDCGATNDFVSSKFISEHKLQETLLESDRKVRGYDGQTRPVAGVLQAALELVCLSRESRQQTVRDQPTVERKFLVADLHNEDVILGLPWLAHMNANLDFVQRRVEVELDGERYALPLPGEHQPLYPLPGLQSRLSRTNRIITTIMNLYDEAPDDKNAMEELSTFLSGRSGEKKRETVRELSVDKEAETVAKVMKEEFKDIFPSELPAGLPPHRNHALSIKLEQGSKVPRRTPPRTSYKHVEFERKWLDDMLAKKLISKSQSDFAAPHFYVDKPDTATSGEYRAVTDFRDLNAITEKNSYPLPRADVLFDRLSGAKYFSKIDLRTGFYQILIEKIDRHKTAFTTSRGLYEYNVLPMGLCNSPAVFMQLMNDTFSEYLNEFVLVFLDDIVVYSKTLEEHTRHLRKVFSKLREQRLFVKLSKSELCRKEVEFLGHYVGENGIRVMEDKIEAIRDWPAPANMRELRAFLGLAGYYRRFVKGYSDIALPLSDLIRTTAGSRFRDHWGEPQEVAFARLKQALQDTPVLELPDPKLPFVINCDASGYAVGAVLQQDKGNGLRPISFMSKKMNAAETRYPVHEQELLAILTALQLWRHHLHGTAQPTRVKTDHKSLVHFQTQPMLSGRQTRWMETLSQFNYEIEYVKGEDNVVADAMSRRSDHNDGSVPEERMPRFVDNKSTFESSTIMTLEGRLMKAELHAIKANMRQHTLHQKEERRKANEYATKVFPAGELELPPLNKAGSRITPTQQCTANAASGNQCKAKTAKGRYCHNHMRMEEGLRVTKSQIADAGLGLFAAKDFAKGDHVADYTGDQLMLRVDQHGGQYVLQLNQREGIDAARTNSGYGRWCNDSRGSGLHANLEFVLNTRNRTGRLRATRAVKKGEELFVAYGAGYWAAYGKEAKVPVRPAAALEGSERNPIEINTLGSEAVEPAAAAAQEEIATRSVATHLSDSFAAEFDKACLEDKHYQQLLTDEDERVDKSQVNDAKFRVRYGRVWCDGRLYVPKNLALRTKILREYHDSATAGHLGRDKTIELVSRYFAWSGMAKQVGEYVTTCEKCQQNKPSQQKPAGALMPIASPDTAGHTWTMDLITQLPESASGNDAIIVWVCKFSKLRHFTACRTDIDAPTLARVFLRDIVRLHGLPRHIISDRDPKFTAHFWKAFWGAVGTTLNMSSAYHPQSDGQTENANKVLEIMLRSVVDFDQKDWDEHLAAAELAINNAKSETTGYTPFYLYYSREATVSMDLAIEQLLKVPEAQELQRNPAAAEEIARWRVAVLRAKENTELAQKRQEKYANQKRREVEYKVGDRVYLDTKNLKLVGVSKRARKLTPEREGPYRITRVINRNAYELDLPPTLKIHNRINISRLQPYKDGSAKFPDRPRPYTRPPPEAVEDSGAPEWEVDRVLDHRKIGRTNRVQYLVRWKGYPDSEATWEPIENLDGALELVVEYNQKKKVNIGVIVSYQEGVKSYS